MSAATASQRFTSLSSSNGPFALYFSDTTPERREADRRYYSLRYNHKPKKPAEKIRKSKLNTSTSSSTPTRSSLEILDQAPSDQHERNTSNTTYSYEGIKLESSSTKVPFALVYDPTSNSFTLQRLGASYGFNLKSEVDYGDATRSSESSEAGGLKSNESVVNGTGHQSSPSSATSPTHSAIHDASGADSDQEKPDPENPFDWRHYIKGTPNIPEKKPKANGSTPVITQAAAGNGSRTVSPLMHSRAPSRSNFASSPSQKAGSTSTPSLTQTPVKRPQQSQHTANPLRAPVTNKRPRVASAASAPLSQPRPTTPTINVETSTPVVASAPSFKGPRPHSHSAPQRPSPSQGSDPNELIIEGEEDGRASRRPHSPGVPSYMTPPGGRPMSLREAASRGASPLIPPRSRPAGGHSRMGSASLSGLGIKGLEEDTSVIDFGSEGAGSRRSNGDIDTDLELGSPAFNQSVKSSPYAQRKTEEQMQSPIRAATPAERASTPAYAPQSPDMAQLNGAQPEDEGNRTQRSNTDELENALMDALGDSHDGGDMQVEREDENEQDLGDALAEALMAAGGEEDNGEELIADEESEEE